MSSWRSTSALVVLGTLDGTFGVSRWDEKSEAGEAGVDALRRRTNGGMAGKRVQSPRAEKRSVEASRKRSKPAPKAKSPAEEPLARPEAGWGDLQDRLGYAFERQELMALGLVAAGVEWGWGVVSGLTQGRQVGSGLCSCHRWSGTRSQRRY